MSFHRVNISLSSLTHIDSSVFSHLITNHLSLHIENRHSEAGSTLAPEKNKTSIFLLLSSQDWNKSASQTFFFSSPDLPFPNQLIPCHVNVWHLEKEISFEQCNADIDKVLVWRRFRWCCSPCQGWTGTRPSALWWQPPKRSSGRGHSWIICGL